MGLRGMGIGERRIIRFPSSLGVGNDLTADQSIQTQRDSAFVLDVKLLSINGIAGDI